MKKILCCIITCVLSLFLCVSCGNSSSPQPSPSQTPTVDFAPLSYESFDEFETFLRKYKISYAAKQNKDNESEYNRYEKIQNIYVYDNLPEEATVRSISLSKQYYTVYFDFSVVTYSINYCFDGKLLLENDVVRSNLTALEGFENVYYTLQSNGKLYSFWHDGFLFRMFLPDDYFDLLISQNKDPFSFSVLE